MESMHSEGRGGPRHGPWMHGGRGRGGVDPGQLQAMQRAMEAPDRLTISQGDGSITLTDVNSARA
jgi:hypothetical protein